MVVVMLLAQCALLVGYFADQSWKRKLPHDDTGEAHKVAFYCDALCYILGDCTAICNMTVHSIKHAAQLLCYPDAPADRAVCGERFVDNQVGCPWRLHTTDFECLIGVLADLCTESRNRGR